MGPAIPRVVPEREPRDSEWLRVGWLGVGASTMDETPRSACTMSRPGRIALPMLALSMPLVLGHFETGLETPVVLLWLGGWLHAHLRFREQRLGAAAMAFWIVGTYLLRPDAVLIPLVVLLLELR